MATIKNPIIRGYNPDPSICRVEDTFYLVTSTFEYFPGITIYKSENLVNWELVGHCLSDHDDLVLDGCRPSGGLFAPTIRYHDGHFFVMCTNTTDKGNFIIHADDINGPWSKPHWVDQGGIDPSLLFDEDGKVYLHSSVEHDGIHEILQCEVNPYTGQKLSDSRPITIGTGGKYPEAPHMYKLFGKYYLILAEGGTEYGHMVTMFRADSPWGPFESCPHNPILSHRGLSAQYHPFQCVGHADIVEDGNGDWWMVALGIRVLPGALLHNIGRETFLARMTWRDDGWPLINENGILTESLEIPGELSNDPVDFEDDFSSKDFSKEYLFLRNPDMKNFVREDNSMRLHASASLESLGSPTLICVRQKEWKAHVTATVHVPEGQGECEAGISAFYCDDQQYNLYVRRKSNQRTIVLKKRLYDITETVELPLENDTVELCIDSDSRSYTFSVVDGEHRKQLGKASVFGLCTEISSKMTFTSAMFGMFCEKGCAQFTHFSVSYNM